MSPKTQLPQIPTNRPTKSSITRLETEIRSLKKEQERLTALKIYKTQGFNSADNQTLIDLQDLIELKELALLQLKLLL